jgi:anti-anti-sigma factor
MFALIVALALFLLVHASTLNSRIRDLGAHVTAETTTGAQLAAQVATTQQATDRYLQQPIQANLQAATASLESLKAGVASARSTIDEPGQIERLDQLDGQLATYQRSFEALGKLLKSQETTRGQLNIGLFDATITLNDAITTYLNSSEPKPAVVATFVRAQQDLQLAILLCERLTTEQSPALGEDALDNLRRANTSLTLQRASVDPTTAATLTEVIDSLERTNGAIGQYTANLPKIREQRDTLLNQQGGQLNALSSAIVSTALDELTATANDLEIQSQQTQQLTLAALVLTLLVSAAFGWLIPRTITHPLMQLVAATRRLTGGDYSVAVSTPDRSEIGELAAAFNQTIAALAQQREEVRQQQAALECQNDELQSTLAELRASTEAREQLAMTVRALSVPVIPILDRVLLIPLVGEIDVERARMLLERLLDSITARRARIAILDITGVPVVDASLVSWLLQATSAAQLMGARCILVGIGPEVAQALVASGADLASLATRSDLRGAVEYAIRSRGPSVAAT